MLRHRLYLLEESLRVVCEITLENNWHFWLLWRSSEEGRETQEKSMTPERKNPWQQRGKIHDTRGYFMRSERQSPWQQRHNIHGTRGIIHQRGTIHDSQEEQSMTPEENMKWRVHDSRDKIHGTRGNPWHQRGTTRRLGRKIYVIRKIWHERGKVEAGTWNVDLTET